MATRLPHGSILLCLEADCRAGMCNSVQVEVLVTIYVRLFA
jgi:hypothetical protein